MEINWHTIVNGDMSGIPRDEELLFTVFDEIYDKNYVIKGFVTNGWPGSSQYKVLETTVRGCRYHKAKKVKAWMELPEPYKGDSARYKMWGNGVALPNVIFVLSGIAEWSKDGNELLCSDEETNNSGSDSYR